MRRFASLMLATLLLIALPAPASAQLVRWLEKLSGPEMIVKGAGIHLPFRCYAWDLQRVASADATEQELRSLPRRVLPGFDSLYCRSSARNHKRVLLGADVALLRNERDGAPEFEHVSAASFMVTLDVGYHAAVEFGIGAGTLVFWGDGFSAFQRLVIQPARVTVKPLVFVSDWLGGDVHWRYLAESVRFQYQRNFRFGTLSSEHFGIEGPWREGTEGFDALTFTFDAFVIVDAIRLLQ